MSTIAIICLVLTILIIVIGISIYNSIIQRKNQVENAFGGMDAQLKKRYDLIPNLVATVEQYAKHEKGLFNEITQLRTQATSGNLSNDEKVELDNKISRSMQNLMVNVENYPDLKASSNFINLQRSLNEVESQISASRRAFNASVTDYNNGIETFPNSIMAGIMNMTRKNVFEIPKTERENVNVDSLFNK